MKNCVTIKFILLLILILSYTSLKGEGLYERNYFNRLANDGENIWIAASKGVVRYNKTEEKVYNANKRLGLEDDDIVNCIKTDKNNNLWFSVEKKGVFCYNGEELSKRNDSYINTLLRLSFAFDSNDSIWISAGGYYISPQIDDIQIGYTTPDNYSIKQNAYIMDMEFDSKDNLWISIFGEYNSILLHKKENTFCESIIAEGNMVIPSLTIDKDDNIWYSIERSIIHYNTTTNSETRYWNDTDSNIPAAHFFASDIDKEENVWFTSSHYLLRYNGENFKWWNCYGYHKARAILCDDDCVWILMESDELFKFEDEKFSYIDLEAEVMNIKENIVSDNKTKAYIANGVLNIENEEGITSVEVYNSLGTPLFRRGAGGENTSIQIPLPATLKGVTIVKVNNEVVKVICN